MNEQFKSGRQTMHWRDCEWVLSQNDDQTRLMAVDEAAGAYGHYQCQPIYYQRKGGTVTLAKIFYCGCADSPATRRLNQFAGRRDHSLGTTPGADDCVLHKTIKTARGHGIFSN